MAKKYFFAILFLMAGALFVYNGVAVVLAYSCDSTSDCTDAGGAPTDSSWYWNCDIPSGGLQECTCEKTGSPPAYKCGKTGGGVGPFICGTCNKYDSGGNLMSTNPLPGQCLRLRAEVKIKKSSDLTPPAEITFPKGAVIAAGPVSKDECRYYNDAGAQVTEEITEDEQCKTTITKDNACWTKDFAIVSLLSTVNYFIKWLFIILMALVTIMIIYGGFLYITSAGSPEKAGKGKSVLIFALIGFAIAILARLLPGIISTLFGLK